MRTNIPEKLLHIADEIGEHGNASLTRLTILKKWFARPERLSAFAIWIARKAVSRKGKAGREAAQLFREARSLLAGSDEFSPKLDREKAQALHRRLRAFQNEYRNQAWGAVRIIRDWNLMLIEEALCIHLWHADSPPLGYQLAADYCRHYDPRHGAGLNGPSRIKIEEIARFMFAVEAWEERRG